MLLKLILFHVLFNIWMNIWHIIQIFFFMMSVWTSAVLPLVKIKPLNHIAALGFLIGYLPDAANKQDLLNWTHRILQTQTFSLSVSWCYMWFLSNREQAAMTHLSLKSSILKKPYHTAGRQLCQLLILIRHPVWAFPHKKLESHSNAAVRAEL